LVGGVRGTARPYRGGRSDPKNRINRIKNLAKNFPTDRRTPLGRERKNREPTQNNVGEGMAQTEQKSNESQKKPEEGRGARKTRKQGDVKSLRVKPRAGAGT